MKQTLEQRLRGGLFAKLSINRQYILEPIPFTNLCFDTNRMCYVETQDVRDVNPYGPVGADRISGNMASVDLSGSSAQMHIHEGPTGNYGQDGQSMAHFKSYDQERLGSLSSYDAAMGHAWAQQMGLPTPSFDAKEFTSLSVSPEEHLLNQLKEFREEMQNQAVRDALAKLIGKIGE